MAFGLDPEQFWKQTPRSLVVILQGAARAAKNRHDAMLSQAWHTEAFARTKKLPKLHDVLGIKKRAQTPDEMIGALMAFQARGANMKIRKIN